MALSEAGKYGRRAILKVKFNTYLYAMAKKLSGGQKGMRPGTKERRALKAKVFKEIAKQGKKDAKTRAARQQNGKGSAAADASIGNNWWMQRSQHGRDKLFASPELLYQAINEHFLYVSKNPMFFKTEHKIVNGKLKQVDTPLPCVYTLEALCLYLQCSNSYFQVFEMTLKKDDPKRQDFLIIIEYVKQTIRNQKFQGAAVGAFNANLIAYDLGLRSDVAQSQTAGVTININDKKDSSVLEDVKKQLNALDE